jgi:putative membrane protein
LNDSQRDDSPLPLLGVRGAIGGILMGLANLVPGISGGTMLLAAGVYPGFISAIAELSTLRFRVRSTVLLATVVASAALAILLLAGTVKDLVVEHRWEMYSLFIGLTLGGVPLVLRMARPLSAPVFLGALGGFALMVLMSLTRGAAGAGGDTSALLMFLSGLAASSAMILPGVSGGYLLLILGQYESILGTIDQLKQGAIMDTLPALIPLGIGIGMGVVGVSNLLRWLLQRFEKATLGVLLGLLLGAVVGLWPFQEPRLPAVEEAIENSQTLGDDTARLDRDDRQLVPFEPTAGQLGQSAALIAFGFGATVLIGRLSSWRTPSN